MAVMLEMLYFCLQAALHLDRHKRTLPAFSVLPMNLSPYLEYPRRTAQHAPADLSVALVFQKAFPSWRAPGADLWTRCILLRSDVATK